MAMRQIAQHIVCRRIGFPRVSHLGRAWNPSKRSLLSTLTSCPPGVYTTADALCTRTARDGRATQERSGTKDAPLLSGALFFDDEDQVLTNQVPEQQIGWYAEVGYDVAPLLWSNRNFTLSPWVRYEQFDFQASVAAGTGLPADPALDGTLPEPW